MTQGKYILIVAGDPSGDLHGQRLARALKAREPGLRIASAGGRLLRAESDVFFADLAELGIVGFVEPIKQLPFLIGLGRRLADFMERERPAALVCIDYYGFNRRVLSLAKRAGVPAYYYISPQVWATRAGRLKTLKRLVERMLLIFPFERRVYQEARIPHTFVGHPLLDVLPEARHAPGDGLRLGLLPGSRASEVSRHLPVFLDAVERIRKDYPKTSAAVFAAAALPDSAYAAARAKGLELVRETDYRRRAGLDLVLTSSGTATLENALLGLPMVVIYKMSWPTYAIARALIRVPYISMANLLAGRKLVPELIQRDATGAAVAEAALRLLEDPRRLAKLREDLVGLRAQLGGPGAADRAAQALLAGLASKKAVPA
ncbi:MAG: lipid-A-disaccharide synthase [Elusimicrobia bacterium]|nr:lipid-A-disaccharide synthase [Elusimicrobiota bacterium]